MKKFIFSSALLAMVLSFGACNKNLNEGNLIAGPVAPEVKSGEVLLDISFGAPMTKVAAQTETNEKSIQNIQIFVFRADTDSNGNPTGDYGMVEIAASAGFPTSAQYGTPTSDLGVTTGSYTFPDKIRCSTGMREVWAVINDTKDHTSGDDAVQTKAEFMALTHPLETSNPSKLLMIGRSNPEGNSAVIQLNEGVQSVNIPVYRQVASVILENITNDMSSPAYQKPGCFRLENCYLINVPGKINFGKNFGVAGYGSAPSAFEEADWYARLAAETTVPRSAILYDNLSQELVEYGSSHTVKHTFYAYPNDCAASTDAAWSPRATLLVLEASIKYASGWVKYYYPVTLDGGLQSNKQYHVGLTIHRPGSLDPNKPVTFSDMTPTITVSNWEDGWSINPEI